MPQSPSACLNTTPEAVAKVVLFPGDPLRAKVLAETYLENAECFNTIRGMFGYTGFYKGRRVSVMGSGMGIPSATIYAHELYTLYGVESIIRIGTAGALSDDVRVRELVIAMSASTNSAFGAQYEFPGTLAPTADFELLRSAVGNAEAEEIPYHVGSVFTTDSFYDYAGTVNQKAHDLGLLACDMETAGIYWEAAACRRRALSILTISNHILTGEETPAEERQNDFNAMMRVALETAWEFAGEE